MIAKLLILHFIADGLLQSREMGKKKSQEFKWLAKHLLIQLTVFFTALCLFGVSPLHALYFSLANAGIHGVIDWNIWRGYKLHAYYKIVRELNADPEMGPATPAKIKYRSTTFQYWEDPWFFHTILFDQMLHGLTYVYLAGLFL